MVDVRYPDVLDDAALKMDYHFGNALKSPSAFGVGGFVGGNTGKAYQTNHLHWNRPWSMIQRLFRQNYGVFWEVGATSRRSGLHGNKLSAGFSRGR